MAGEAIRQVLAAKAEAMVRRSAEGLAAQLHDDFIYVNARGTRFDKSSYVETYCTSGRITFHDQEIADLQVTEFPGFAVATLTLHDRFSTGGREVSATYRSLCVFSATGGKWLWAAGQTMPAS